MATQRLIISRATIHGSDYRGVGDIAIADGRIAEIASRIAPNPDDKVIEAEGLIAAPAFVDVHVHLREPGFGYKERIATGSLAAARGGYSTVCAMPNLNPVPDSVETLDIEKVGPIFENNSIFPERVNAEFVKVLDVNTYNSFQRRLSDCHDTSVLQMLT